jgi:protoporphyrinogen oxidase
MQTNQISIWILFFALSGLSVFSQAKDLIQQDSEKRLPTLECDVSIIGGGPAGLYMAYQLGPLYRNQVCLFEKENRLGGRIYDIGKDPQQPQGPLIAVGGRRVMEGQNVLFKLAHDLGIELEKPNLEKELIFARGFYSTNPDDFVALYPGIEFDQAKGDAPTQLLRRLLVSEQRKQIDQFPDFKSYVTSVLGNNGFEYLRDMSRFRSDFEYSLSAKGYLDFLEEDIDVCCEASYPVGGMSAYVRGLALKAKESGVRIYLEEPVKSIDKESKHYSLVTPKHRVNTSHVVITVPPKAFDHIQGNISRAIQSQDQYKSLIGVNVVTIAQWYEKPWWLNIRGIKDNKKVWRAWTTESCINSIEIPQEQYAAKQNVIRSVYSDSLECVEKWREIAKEGPRSIEREVKKGLEHLFSNNGVTHPVEIGEASKTFYWEWPDGWYYIRAGFPFSTLDIFNWAVQPLKDENVALAGESYNPQRATWSDGAYKSAIHLLNKRYGFSIVH